MVVGATAGVPCIGGLHIANSNRSSGSSQCAGELGDECHYACDPGYLAIGRHVCQTYQAGGETFIKRSFFGGRCERLCAP